MLFFFFLAIPLTEPRVQQGTLASVGSQLDRGQPIGGGRRAVPQDPLGPVVHDRGRDLAQRLRHLQLQSGPELRSVRRAGLPVVVQLLLLQQEAEAHRLLHLSGHQVSIFSICLSAFYMVDHYFGRSSSNKLSSSSIIDALYGVFAVRQPDKTRALIVTYTTLTTKVQFLTCVHLD